MPRPGPDEARARDAAPENRLRCGAPQDIGEQQRIRNGQDDAEHVITSETGMRCQRQRQGVHKTSPTGGITRYDSLQDSFRVGLACQVSDEHGYHFLHKTPSRNELLVGMGRKPMGQALDGLNDHKTGML